MAVLLLLTFVTTYTVTEREEQTTLARFEARTTTVVRAIQDRMIVYTQALKGGLGLFRSSGHVNRSAWRNYVAALDINHLYPGIQGLGYAEWVRPEQRESYVDAIRSEGFPEFRIHPPGDRRLYSSVTYIEPFDQRNRRTFGYDMHAEETRRRAMDTARDTGKATISGKLTLIQDTQPGFLMYLPLYETKRPQTVEERRRESIGFVYSPFRMRDLMYGILGLKLTDDVRLRIYDSDENTADSLMFDSAPEAVRGNPKFEGVRIISVGQRNWTIKTASLPKFEAQLDTQKSYITLIAGLITSLLVFGVLWSFANTRRRAQGMATKMIVSLKNAMQQAQDRQARISAVLETVIDGIVTIDNRGTVETFNPAAERIFGYTSDEIAGHNVKVLMPEPYRAEHDTYLKNYRDTGNAQVIGNDREVIGRRKDGSTFPMDLAIGEMVIDGRQMFTGIVRDISERKQIEKMKSEFVSTVSHELRTPLTSIMGSLGLLKSNVLGELPDQTNEILEIAYKNGDRLVNLLNDILDIEKIEAGKMEYDMRPLDIAGLMESAVEANKGYADSYGITFVLPDTIEPAQIYGDEARLMQVMSNLMSNAAKFSERGGQVDVSVTRKADRVRITVKDYGPGIRSEYRDRIFEKFSQADSSDARAKTGTGLGLSITRSIVESHGGTIDFESDSGRGTAFYFELPVFPAQAQGHAANLESVAE